MAAHILLVEDHPDNSRLITWLLEDEGYQVTWADSGERCLDLLKEAVFDLVLMDITLPGIGGKETTQIIRNLPEFSKLPILALTAHADSEELRLISESGVDGILSKPIDEPKMMASIKAQLERYEK
jgi:two-component system, cell cycle response regulator DivK